MATYELKDAQGALVNRVALDDINDWPTPLGHTLTLVEPPEPPPPEPADYKAQRKAELAAIRFTHETAGIVVNGASIDTGLESQAKINGAWAGAQVNPAVVIDWKRSDGTWVQIDAATITGIAMAVFSHVQACYTREMQLSQLIDAAEDIAEIDAVDLTVGWP
jgi:hypothetical protein